ncbi:MAG: type II toxin-antitoxin system RelE/ParE family toxin [Longimicrobiaceae bacterium]
MTLHLVLRPEVEAEVTKAYLWYKRRSPSAGTAFLRAVDDRIESIRADPERYRLVYRHARRALLSRFPYALYFGLAGSDVVVVACCHTRRRPSHWQSRVRKFLR